MSHRPNPAHLQAREMVLLGDSHAPWVSSCDTADGSLEQHRFLIYRSRSVKQHPAFVPVLTDCLFNKSPQKGDSCVPHPEVQA